MSNYQWRSLTPKERAELLAWRRLRQNPWHSPPHRPNFGNSCFHITAACYEHQDYIGQNPERMDEFTRNLLALLAENANQTFAWCVLPNHYHALVESFDILSLLRQIGLFHGRTSYAWNGEENARGRKVFFRTVDRAMRSERHFFATLNYVHHNPVHHGYAERWTEWRWSSAAEYLAQTSIAEAKRIWREYPIGKYGKGWDDPEK